MSAWIRADEDVRIARERGIPVYFRVEDVPGFAPHRQSGQ
jgi:hypothetical protein